jgi:Na+-translocating ferredoxin:NAD+ oxidoreductase RnfA subunit
LSYLRINPWFDYSNDRGHSLRGSATVDEDIYGSYGKEWRDSITAPNAGQLLRTHGLNRTKTNNKRHGYSMRAASEYSIFLSPAHDDRFDLFVSGKIDFTNNVNRLYEHYNLEYMQTIVYILVIASLVQMVEIVLKKLSPALYQALGIFLPLITTNCAVLGVAILVIQKEMNLGQALVYALSTAIGFGLALTVFAAIREQLELTDIPKGMRGMAIVLVTAGLLSLAFMGFSGVDSGLRGLLGIE